MRELRTYESEGAIERDTEEAQRHVSMVWAELAIPDDLHQHNGYAALRRELMSRGVLVSAGDGKLLHFTRDTAFASSSAAAAVILNRQASGPKEWKLAGSGTPLGQWREPDQASYDVNSRERSPE